MGGGGGGTRNGGVWFKIFFLFNFNFLICNTFEFFFSLAYLDNLIIKKLVTHLSELIFCL